MVLRQEGLPGTLSFGTHMSVDDSWSHLLLDPTTGNGHLRDAAGVVLAQSVSVGAGADLSVPSRLSAEVFTASVSMTTAQRPRPHFVTVVSMETRCTFTGEAVHEAGACGSIVTGSRLAVVSSFVFGPEGLQLLGQGEDLSSLFVRTGLLQTLSLQVSHPQLLQE